MHQKSRDYVFMLQEQHQFGSPAPAAPAPVSAPAAPPAPPPAPSAPTPAQKQQAQAPVNAATGLQQTVLAPPAVDTTQGVQKKTLLGQ